MQAEIRRIKTEYWETFTADMEHDLYGSQKKIMGIDKTKETQSQRICNSKNYPGRKVDKLLQTNVRRR